MSAARTSRKRSPIKDGESAITQQEPEPPGPPKGTPRSRITPRNSIANEAIAAAAKETPYETLRHLASVIPRPTTPLRRASSAGPPSTHRSNRRTPSALDRTPAGVQQGGSTRRANALTPHARAAFRENELRRAAALTPGRDRRQSGRQQRETPRDVLRALSRALAPNTRPIEVTPQIDAPSRAQRTAAGINDGLDDGPEPTRPRLSMNLGNDDEDDDSFLLPPQRSAGFVDEDDLTQRSVELPRRAVSELPGGRLSRGSFGSIRTSENFRDLIELGLSAEDAEALDSSFIQQGNFEDDEDQAPMGDPTLPR
jgi:hypothetical protein